MLTRRRRKQSALWGRSGKLWKVLFVLMDTLIDCAQLKKLPNSVSLKYDIDEMEV